MGKQIDLRRRIMKMVEIRADDLTSTWDSPLSGAAVVSSLVDIIVEYSEILTPIEFGVLTRATAMIFRQAMTPPVEAEPKMEAAE